MCKKLLIKYVIEFILIIMKKIREKNRSVASGLSVIDFEHGERAEGERAHQWGTVFQTALPYVLNTRDFVPGYSRFARYWLPDKAINNQTRRQPDNKTIH